MGSKATVKWTFFKRAKFVLTYAFYKLCLLRDVKSPKFRFLLFEARYSLVNLINTIRPETFKPVLYSGPEILRTRSGTFRVRSGSQDAAIASPAFERQDMQFLARVLRDDFIDAAGAAVLDVGANIGVYSIQTALRTGAKIWAFEPIEENRKVLIENLRLNSMGEDRVTVLPFALGGSDGQVVMYYSRAFPGHASTDRSNAERERAKEFRVERRRADDLFPDPFERLLVKIDVEGHELEVIEGMRGILSSAHLVWICIEDVFNRDALHDLLQRIGFEFKAKLTPYNSWWKKKSI